MAVPLSSPEPGMPRKRTLPDSELPAVTRMFRAGASDDALARFFDCSTTSVKRFRYRHGLFKPKGRFVQQVEPQAPCPAFTTYEENGRIITKLPPGYAHGVAPEPTVRVRQKRRQSSY